MVNIGDLPEDILLDLLSLVPGRDLLRNCRLVCSHWRDLVDLGTLWKRKSQREGYLPKEPDRSVPDWKNFYFLCILKRNLIKNPLAEDSFNHWSVLNNGGNKWKIEDQPELHGREFPHPHVQKFFVTSYRPCTKFQRINLKEEGYWNELMDEAKPDIVVKDWFSARYNCSCQYKLNVKLLSAYYQVLEEFNTEEVVINQWSDAEWREISHTFHNYPSGIRHIVFKHGGRDIQHWAGWYGVRITNSSITIGPEVAE
ncbi:F-box only protein 6-like [Eublepharis macularius]|uniref:F-box only protein 6-like n=1 Tax=Eublepharis macularius TaxID=481883 RepID=A0AA97LIP7_EUBMA|nr:F-box only protein 6-like [Eublepharis macularius]XP_054857748.1 F-box only protein 6-like [Eublepharis macularius]XP_054857749.1 F-box only protein 6-like [Eublepharis macularius]